MRKSFSRQLRLDGGNVLDVAVNLDCRDEIIPILVALKHTYATTQPRDEILNLIQKDVLGKAKAESGRKGLDLWQILVLAEVRLGCHLDYDKLQDLADNHRALRDVMGVGDFDQTHFTGKRIRDNVCRSRSRVGNWSRRDGMKLRYLLHGCFESSNTRRIDSSRSRAD